VNFSYRCLYGHRSATAFLPHPQAAALTTSENRMADKETLQGLLADEIKDLYSAEKQLTKAIPKMAKGSNNADLATAFRNHLQETLGQVSRLEEVARMLDIKPTGKKCAGMEGVIKEGAEALEEEGNEVVLDLGIIGAGCRVEHYEIVGYTTAISLAQQIGAKEAVTLLQQSLAEEKAADQGLRKIAGNMIKAAPLQK
jgi:ferritin-like metal-binding protein YciE